MTAQKPKLYAVEIRVRKILEPLPGHETTRVQILAVRHGGKKEWKTLEYKYQPAPRAARKLIRFAIQEMENE